MSSSGWSQLVKCPSGCSGQMLRHNGTTNEVCASSVCAWWCEGVCSCGGWSLHVWQPSVHGWVHLVGAMTWVGDANRARKVKLCSLQPWVVMHTQAAGERQPLLASHSCAGLSTCPSATKASRAPRPGISVVREQPLASTQHVSPFVPPALSSTCYQLVHPLAPCRTPNREQGS